MIVYIYFKMSKKELPKSPAAAAYILEEGNILSLEWVDVRI